MLEKTSQTPGQTTLEPNNNNITSNNNNTNLSNNNHSSELGSMSGESLSACAGASTAAEGPVPIYFNQRVGWAVTLGHHSMVIIAVGERKLSFLSTSSPITAPEHVSPMVELCHSDCLHN